MAEFYAITSRLRNFQLSPFLLCVKHVEQDVGAREIPGCVSRLKAI
jgi:hypothetical protein